MSEVVDVAIDSTWFPTLVVALEDAIEVYPYDGPDRPLDDLVKARDAFRDLATQYSTYPY